jgi:hypothetical protein
VEILRRTANGAKSAVRSEAWTPMASRPSEPPAADSSFSCSLQKKPGCPVIADPPDPHVIKNQKFLSNASDFLSRPIGKSVGV